MGESALSKVKENETCDKKETNLIQNQNEQLPLISMQ
jgi:hypothetical protein